MGNCNASHHADSAVDLETYDAELVSDVSAALRKFRLCSQSDNNREASIEAEQRLVHSLSEFASKPNSTKILEKLLEAEFPNAKKPMYETLAIRMLHEASECTEVPFQEISSDLLENDPSEPSLDVGDVSSARPTKNLISWMEHHHSDREKRADRTEATAECSFELQATYGELRSFLDNTDMKSEKMLFSQEALTI